MNNLTIAQIILLLAVAAKDEKVHKDESESAIDAAALADYTVLKKQGLISYANPSAVTAEGLKFSVQILAKGKMVTKQIRKQYLVS